MIGCPFKIVVTFKETHPVGHIVVVYGSLFPIRQSVLFVAREKKCKQSPAPSIDIIFTGGLPNGIDSAANRRIPPEITNKNSIT